MEVRHLSSLIAIADHGSFSAAARALGTVQSNVSAHIARLEKELGASLVDRASGQLTEEGAVGASSMNSKTSKPTFTPTMRRSKERPESAASARRVAG